MIPIQHDISLVIGSTLFAFVAGYFLMPIQKYGGVSREENLQHSCYLQRPHYWGC